MLPKSYVTKDPNRRHIVVTLSNRPLRRRFFEPKQLANQTLCDHRFRRDVTTGQAPSCLRLKLLHFERRVGNRTGRVSNRQALASENFRAVFSQNNNEDRRHVRAEFVVMTSSDDELRPTENFAAPYRRTRGLPRPEPRHMSL